MRRGIVLGTGVALTGASIIALAAGCRSIDPAWVADANVSPSKTSRVFLAPPSRVGPALLSALDDLGVRVDAFQVRDAEQGNIVDLETTREDQRQPGAAFKNTEILSAGTRFSSGLVGPDLLDGEVRRGDGRVLRFASVEAVFHGKTPDNRSVVVTTKGQGRSTAVNVSVGNFGDSALSRALFSSIDSHLNAIPETRATPK